jgi:hypothetical protein
VRAAIRIGKRSERKAFATFIPGAAANPIRWVRAVKEDTASLQKTAIARAFAVFFYGVRIK